MILMARDARDITVISTTLTSMPASVCLAVVLRTVARGKSDAVSDFDLESATAARMRHDAVRSFLAELHSEPVVERAMPEAIFHGQQRARACRKVWQWPWKGPDGVGPSEGNPA